MATYEYICPECNLEFEVTRPMSESDKAANCPNCKALAQKQFSSFGCKTGGSLQASEKRFRKSSENQI